MENRTQVEVRIEKVIFFEAKIINKNTLNIAEVITNKNLKELENSVNIWLKCGKYSLTSLDKVEREQISVSH